MSSDHDRRADDLERRLADGDVVPPAERLRRAEGELSDDEHRDYQDQLDAFVYDLAMSGRFPFDPEVVQKVLQKFPLVERVLRRTAEEE